MTGIATNKLGNLIGLQCCEDGNPKAIRKNFANPQYDCLKGITFDEAQGACVAEGYRLCTQAEVETEGMGRGTGCGFAGYHVWTSTPCTIDVASSLADTNVNIPVSPIVVFDASPWIAGLVMLCVVLLTLNLCRMAHQRRNAKYVVVDLADSETENCDAEDAEL